MSVQRAILFLSVAALAACQRGPEPARAAEGAYPYPQPQPGPGVAIASVPAAFRGEWRDTPAACGKADDPIRIVLTADTLASNGASGPIRSLTAHGTDTISGTAELTGGGETRPVPFLLRLAADGRSLTDAMEHPPATLVRCPDQSAVGIMGRRSHVD